MTDNGTPFVAIVRTMLSRFQRSLAELRIHHIRIQVDTPWTNGKVEAFWATLQAEVLDHQQLVDLAAAEAAVTAKPATTTTTASTASSTGIRRASGSMERPSPIAGSPVSRRSPASPTCSTRSLLPDRSLIFTGEDHLARIQAVNQDEVIELGRHRAVS
jgi:transposase InsO family protein